jgi:Beta protein
MLGRRHYVPVLQGKIGEYSALAKLSRKVYDRCTPLIGVPPIRRDWRTRAPKRSVGQQVRAAADGVLECWGTGCPVFVDVAAVASESRGRDELHPVTRFHEDARDRAIFAVPVVGVDRADDYQEAIAHAAAIDQHGVCIRLVPPDLDNSARLAARLESLLHQQLALEPEEADLLVDLKGFQPDRVGLQLKAARSALRALPHVDRWRSLILAQSAFPHMLSMIARDTTATLARAEWPLWRELWEERAELPRLPTFADYAAEAPGFFEGDFVDPAAVIRYTVDDAWLILRGHNLSQPDGYSQFRQLARRLITHPQYRGPAFSDGDRYIYDCAQGVSGTGNPTTWRQAAVSHHLTLVAQELANLVWP